MDRQAQITPSKPNAESSKSETPDGAIAVAKSPPGNDDEEDEASVSYLGSSHPKEITMESTLKRLIKLFEIDVANDPYKIVDTLKILFHDYGINSFSSLAMMTEDDLKDPTHGQFVGAFKNVLFRRKFLTLLTFCRRGLPIQPNMDFNSVIQGVSLPPQPPYTPPTPPIAFGTASKDSTPKISFDKDFLTFNGSDKTWKTWKRSIINATGVAGGKPYLTI
jgi:hypothetical protein